MNETTSVQLIWNGSDGYIVADEHNTENAAWPVQDAAGRWHEREFDGQRVLFDRQNVYFGFFASEVAQENLKFDDEGDVVADDDMYLIWCGQKYKWFKAV